MNVVDVSFTRLAAGYGLLTIPMAVLLWYRVPLVAGTVAAIVRMTVQLLFVGLYLQIVFTLDRSWLTGLWLFVMICVADISVVRGCRLRLRRFAVPLFAALLAGTAIPMCYFMGVIVGRSDLIEARFAIPISGMILGNCLRADIIGVRSFYESIRKDEKVFQTALAQGARLTEATRPHMRESCRAALAPTVATMATIGLVALPGMMTGVILGGADPMTAIKYQIAIMIAIVAGTAITVALAIRLTMHSSFTSFGVLDPKIFKKGV